MKCWLQAIGEMAMIKAQGDREQAMSEAEWKQLSNLIENDRRERVLPLLPKCGQRNKESRVLRNAVHLSKMDVTKS